MNIVVKCIMGIGCIYMLTGMIGLFNENAGTYAIIHNIHALDYISCEADISYTTHDGKFMNSTVLIPCNNNDGELLLPIRYSVMFPEKPNVGYILDNYDFFFALMKIGLLMMILACPFIMYVERTPQPLMNDDRNIIINI